MSDRAIIWLLSAVVAIALCIIIPVTIRGRNSSPVAPEVKTIATKPVAVVASSSAPASLPTVSSLPATRPSARIPLKSSVSGAAWVTRNNGSSDLMRGLNISIVEPTISKRALLLAMNDVRKECDDLLATYRELSSSEFRQEASQRIEKEFKIGLDIAKHFPEDIDLSAAYQVPKLASPNGIPYNPVVYSEHKPLHTTRTDVDGKFVFLDVPEGDYYVYANFVSPTLQIEWLVPLHVVGKPIKLDLFNANAITVKDVGN